MGEASGSGPSASGARDTGSVDQRTKQWLANAEASSTVTRHSTVCNWKKSGRFMPCEHCRVSVLEGKEHSTWVYHFTVCRTIVCTVACARHFRWSFLIEQRHSPRFIGESESYTIAPGVLQALYIKILCKFFRLESLSAASGGMVGRPGVGNKAEHIHAREKFGS